MSDFVFSAHHLYNPRHPALPCSHSCASTRATEGPLVPHATHTTPIHLLPSSTFAAIHTPCLAICVCTCQYMRLDTAATQALNLFPGPMDGGNKSMSIFGVLDQCKTAQGKRLLSQWIKQPLLDKARIEERLNLVEVLFEGSDLRNTVMHGALKRLPDLNRLAKKFHRHTAKPQDVVRVCQAIEMLPSDRTARTALLVCLNASFLHPHLRSVVCGPHTAPPPLRRSG